MKHFFTIMLLISLPYYLLAQTKISPQGNLPQCPGNIVSYSAYPSGGSASADYKNCSFKWSITKGKFFLTGNSNDYTTINSSVDVIWDDVTQKGELKVIITSCSNTANNGSPTTGGVIIKSINGVNPSQVKVNGTAYSSYNLSWCSTSPITLSIDRLKIPNTPSASDPIYNTQLYTDWYEWTLPTGWRTSDNQTGTFTTPYYSITVIPAAGEGGQVKVRGYNYDCSTFSSPSTQFFSNYSTITINREPMLGAITASKTTVNCSDTSPVTLSIPALPNAAYYTWSLPAGWSISGTATGNTITAIPSGTGPGQVSVSAIFTCTSPAKTVNSNSITIGYNTTLVTPAFSSAPYDIGSSTAYSVQPVPGATSYTWSASSNILINGQSSPLTTQATSVTLSQRPGESGLGWVRVTANNTLCNSSYIQKDVWVGLPEIIGFSYDCGWCTPFNYPACPYEQGIFEPIFNGYPPGQILEYKWTVTNVSYHAGLTAPSLFVVAPGQHTTRMIIELEVRTSNGWSPKRIEEYEVRDCDAGAEPWFAPNPVTEDEFTIESESSESYAYSLYDQQGHKKLSGKSKVGKTRVSTKGLPAGLYFINIEYNGRTSKKPLVIKR